MSARERREQILRAAGEVFGRHGYTGATTDQIARAAGISQPYVVRMFGTKEALFLEVLDRSRVALLDAFRQVLRSTPARGQDLREMLGDAYVDLIRDRGIHLPLMHGFLQGTDPVVGAAARAGFLDIWRFLRAEGGFSAEAATAFLGHGMLINVLLGLGMPAAADADADAAALVAAACGDQVEFVLQHAG